MKTEKKQSKKEQKESADAATLASSSKISTRGRIFEGTIMKKFPTRVIIEMERVAYIKKYERFYKKKSKIHARLPSGIDVAVGDIIQIQECRPLSKIIHAIVIKKVKSGQSSANFEIKEAKK